MSIEIVKGNLLDGFDKGEVDVIMHIVNCQKVMSSGIALSIKQRYPEVFRKYCNYSDLIANNGINLLGQVQVVELIKFEELPPLFKNGKSVVNLFAQDTYGRDKRQLNYGALGQGLSFLNNKHLADYIPTYRKIGIPFKLGSDRAGGSWEIVSEMIEFFFRNHNVKIYQL